MAHVWGNQWIGDPHTSDVHIRWLRLKIKDDPDQPRYIKTAHGLSHRYSGLKEKGVVEFTAVGATNFLLRP